MTPKKQIPTKNNEVKTWHLLVFTFLCALMIFMIYDKPEIVYDNLTTNCNEDSLKNVITNLNGTIESESKNWDKREEKYEEIIFEYQYGLSRLKETHPEAYREFHRTIGFKEKYSRSTEIENKQRMQMGL